MPDRDKQTVRRGHEAGEIAARRIAWTAVGLATTLVVVVLIAWAVLMVLSSNQPSSAPQSVRDLPSRLPAPTLQNAPARDLRAFREEKHVMLNTYRWLDRSKGVMQIPIDRAMQLIGTRDQAAARDIGKNPESHR